MEKDGGVLNVFSQRAIDIGLVTIALALLLYAGTASRGTIADTSSQPFAAPTVATAPPLVYLKNMTALRGQTAYSLDVVQQPQSDPFIVARRPAAITVRRATQTSLIGWAVDSPSQRSADAVYVLLDGKLVTACHVASARPDVAAALRNPAYVTSGFACVIEPNDVVVGRHHMQFDVVAQGGHTFYVAKPATVLVVR